MHASLREVIRSWLRDRPASVIVGGRHSCEYALSNMVFQGTVGGPVLWNSFFGVSICAIESNGFIAVIYADDLNAFKTYPSCTANERLWRELRECQR